MKKLPIIIFFLIALISCDTNSAFIPSLDRFNDDETPSTICIPAFINAGTEKSGRISSTSGIIDMTPEDSPFGDYSEATSVMVTMPVMVGLNTIDNRDGNAFSRIDPHTYGYGFPLRFDRNHSRINNDGAYIRYDIMSEYAGWENDAVGRIDYYYNAKDQTFSYRQVVALTIDPSDFAQNMGFNVPTPIFQTSVLIIQYDDIELDGVEPDGMVSFNTVEFDRNGEIEPKVTIDLINFGNLSFHENTDLLYDEKVFNMSRYYPMIRSANGKYVSLNLPYISELFTDEKNYPENMKELITSVAGENLRIDNEAEARNVNLDFAMQVMNELYKSPYKHDTYHSYGNFTSDNIGKITGLDLIPAGELIQQDGTKYNTSVKGPSPTIYDFENNVIATSQNMVSGALGDLYIYDDAAYDTSNFKDFFGALSFSDQSVRQESIKKLVKDFLSLLGINNETYAENYYRMVKQSARREANNSIYAWFTGVPVNSVDSPDEFENKLIEAYKTLNPGSIQFENTQFTGIF